MNMNVDEWRWKTEEQIDGLCEKMIMRRRENEMGVNYNTIAVDSNKANEDYFEIVIKLNKIFTCLHVCSSQHCSVRSKRLTPIVIIIMIRKCLIRFCKQTCFSVYLKTGILIAPCPLWGALPFCFFLSLFVCFLWSSLIKTRFIFTWVSLVANCIIITNIIYDGW